MKFSLNSGAFAEAIAAGISSLPSRPTSPILGGVLIEAQIGAVSLSSFNYDRATTRLAAADVMDTDTAVVSGRLLAAVGANLPKNTESTVTASGNEMVITVGRSEYRLPLMHADDYPKLPEVTSKDVIGTVDTTSFNEAIRAIGAFAAPADTKPPALTALNFACTPTSLTLSATDSYMIGRRRLDWDGSASLDFNAIASDVLGTIKAVSTSDEIEILCNGNMIGLRTPSTLVVSRVLDEKFPSVDRYLKPQTYYAATTVKTADLVSMLKRAASMADDQPAQVNIVAEDGSLSVTTTRSATGNITDAAEAAHIGGRRQLALSARRLHNALAAVDETQTTLAFKEDGHLVYIHPGPMPQSPSLATPPGDTVALLIGMRT